MKDKKELQKNKFGVRYEWVESFSAASKKKGFIILISIVISSFMVSIGIFISDIAYKELVLSSSTQSSQKAFYVADSVMECALKADIRDLIFDNADNEDFANSIKFKCNGKIFLGVNSIGSVQKTEYPCHYATEQDLVKCYNGTFVYYISFAETGLNPEETPLFGGHVIVPELQEVKDAPYAKVIFEKNYIGDIGYSSDNDSCPTDNPRCKDETIIKAYGHNKYSGRGIVERALETRL